MTIEKAFQNLARSPFRSRFHLSEKDKEYIRKNGMDAIVSHAKEFIKSRLAPAYIPNDGKQTPMRGHPVFVAQHACACCCRGCLNKWYHVPLGTALSPEQQQKISDLLMAWMQKELSFDTSQNK